jgi:Fe2+ transport system protein FeoA
VGVLSASPLRGQGRFPPRALFPNPARTSATVPCRARHVGRGDGASRHRQDDPLSPPTGNEIACPSCGYRYDPHAASGCASCPLNSACAVSCCPACGFGALDLQRSWIARLVTRLAARRAGGAATHEAGGVSLTDLPCGGRAVISALDGVPVDSRERLQAYGLVPGRRVEVVHAAAGVTIVRVGHVELAFESDLAGAIRVGPAET